MALGNFNDLFPDGSGMLGLGQMLATDPDAAIPLLAASGMRPPQLGDQLALGAGTATDSPLRAPLPAASPVAQPLSRGMPAPTPAGDTLGGLSPEPWWAGTTAVPTPMPMPAAPPAQAAQAGPVALASAKNQGQPLDLSPPNPGAAGGQAAAQPAQKSKMDDLMKALSGVKAPASPQMQNFSALKPEVPGRPSPIPAQSGLAVLLQQIMGQSTGGAAQGVRLNQALRY